MSYSNFKTIFFSAIILILVSFAYSAPSGAVILNSPADGTANIQTPVTLIWTAPTNTDFYLYTLQIASDAAFQSPFLNENTTATSFSVSRNFASNKKYYWRVIAQKKLSLNEPTTAYYISDPWSFYTAGNLTPVLVALPAVPELLAPTNNLTTVPLTAKLTWKNAQRATSYSLQVSIDGRFVTSSLKINKSNILANYYETGYVSGTQETILKPNTRYYWRVRAENAGGNSGWSNYYSFVTISSSQITPPPASVDLISPLSGVTYNCDNTSSINFAWGTSSKATSYTLQVSTDITFTTLKTSVTTNATSHIINLDTMESSRFYWRVLSTNTSGNSVSSTRMFTVMPKILISPLNAELIEDDGGNITFSWDLSHYVNDDLFPTYEPAYAAYTYDVDLQYADNPNFTNFQKNAIGSSSTTSTTITKATFNKGVTYYWRLKLIQTTPTPGTYAIASYTASRSFKVIAAQVPVVVPAAPVLDKPANNTNFSINTILNADAPITFNWTTYQAGVNYTLNIAADNAFTNIKYTKTVNTISTSISRTALPVGTYYWRVTASNVNGVPGASKSEVRTFTISNVNTYTTFNTNVATLTSPTNGTIVSAASVKLSWKEINNPTLYPDLKYNLQISGNLDMSTPILTTQIAPTQAGGLIEYEIGSDFGATKAILVPNSTYYWRVSITDNVSGETTNWSTVWSFTTETSKVLAAPNVPSLISPADNTTGVGLTPIFYWNAVDKADYYHFQISTSNTFASILYDQDQITSINIPMPTSLTMNTVYYWRVQAVNIIGISAYTASQFTTRDTSEAATLLSPSNNSTTGLDSILFSWNAINGVLSYQYELSTNNSFTNIILTQTINAPVTETTVTNADVTLVKANRYYWRVFGQTAAGTGQVSPVWSFTVQSDYTPTNGAVNLPLKPTLGWPASSAPFNAQISYHVQLSASSSFLYVLYSKSGLPGTSVVIAASDNSAILSYNTTYYWRVRNVINGVTGAWSFPFRFSTLQSPVALPGAVNNQTPANNTLNVDAENDLTMTWSSGSNAATYTLQISPSANFSPITINQTGILAATYSLTSIQRGLMLPNKNYYWRVRSENSAGSSIWSSYSLFKTKPMSVITLSRPIVKTPADTAVSGTGNVTFTYNPVSGATQYNLVIATSPDFNINSIISNTVTSGTPNLSKTYNFTQTGIYYWRVKAIRDLDTTDNIIDGESEFSLYRTLNIQ